MKRFSKWWNAERTDGGTSQEMCSTNGDTVVLALIQSVPLTLCLIYRILTA